MLQILDILLEKANDGLRELVRLWHSSWADVAVKVACTSSITDITG